MHMAWPGARRLLSAQRRPGAARGDMSTAPQSGNLLLLSSRWGLAAVCARSSRGLSSELSW